MTTHGVDRSGAAGGTGTAETPVPITVVDAKGDLIVGTGADAVDNLTVGANETRLVADSAQPTGLKYVADTTNYAVAAKGDILAGTAADTVAPVTVGTDGKVLMAEAAQATGVAWNEVPLPRSYLAGLGLANNSGDATNDIDFAVGAARNSTNVANLVAATAMTKRLDAAWAAGTAAGGRMSAAAITDTTYHCYVIRKDSDGTCDFGFDTSATAPTMPAGYTYFRRIGSIIRASGAIVAFFQDGDFFQRKTPGNDVDGALNPGTSAVTRTLFVPIGIRVIARVNVVLRDPSTAGAYIFYLSDLDTDDLAPGISTPGNQGGNTGSDARNGAQVDVRTNTSGQIRSRIAVSDADTSLNIFTCAWFDSRGRND